MKFDHTFIAIRQRTTLEIYDLALHVLRDYFFPIMALLIVGALPWLILDWLLLGWMLGPEYCDNYAVSLLGLMSSPSDYDSYAVGFSWLMTLLVFSQAQLGTAMISHYLGQSMFIGKPRVRDSIRIIWSAPFSYYWLHYIVRGVFPIVIFVWAIRGAQSDDDLTGLAVMMLILLTLVGGIVRVARPYITKIIVLEKAPWKANEQNPISFGKRSQSLHGSGNGNLLGGFLTSVILAIPLSLGVYGLSVMAFSSIMISWSHGFLELAILWPISLWLVAGFFSIVRFLTYIDLRIRQEGWEVELRIRAEALKMEQAI